MATIVARTLGIPVDQVSVLSVDTDVVPYDLTTSSAYERSALHPEVLEHNVPEFQGILPKQYPAAVEPGLVHRDIVALGHHLPELFDKIQGRQLQGLSHVERRAARGRTACDRWEDSGERRRQSLTPPIILHYKVLCNINSQLPVRKLSDRVAAAPSCRGNHA